MTCELDFLNLGKMIFLSRTFSIRGSKYPNCMEKVFRGSKCKHKYITEILRI